MFSSYFMYSTSILSAAIVGRYTKIDRLFKLAKIRGIVFKKEDNEKFLLAGAKNNVESIETIFRHVFGTEDSCIGYQLENLQRMNYQVDNQLLIDMIKSALNVKYSEKQYRIIKYLLNYVTNVEDLFFYVKTTKIMEIFLEHPSININYIRRDGLNVLGYYADRYLNNHSKITNIKSPFSYFIDRGVDPNVHSVLLKYYILYVVTKDDCFCIQSFDEQYQRYQLLPDIEKIIHTLSYENLIKKDIVDRYNINMYTFIDLLFLEIKRKYIYVIRYTNSIILLIHLFKHFHIEYENMGNMMIELSRIYKNPNYEKFKIYERLTKLIEDFTIVILERFPSIEIQPNTLIPNETILDTISKTNELYKTFIEDNIFPDIKEPDIQ